jgi:hypothetical protein
MKTFSASLTNLMALLLHSHDCSCYLSRLKLTSHGEDSRKTLTHEHTTSPSLTTCDISPGSVTLPAPEAGEFMELILLYIVSFVSKHSAAVIVKFYVQSNFISFGKFYVIIIIFSRLVNSDSQSSCWPWHTAVRRLRAE